MSAFAVIFERSGAPLQPDALERPMERLRHRGPDGSDTLRQGRVAFGHWRFWTTPEEVGERQPLRLAGLPYILVFDGRLDNRAELLAALQLERTTSDAALVVQAFDRWGRGCFARFVGEFALVIFDETRGELTCARDPLGERSLFHASRGTLLAVASEPWAAAALEASPPALSESAAAHYFALRVPSDGQTLFEGVRELPPAHTLTVNGGTTQLHRYWEPDLSRKIRFRSNEEYAEGFRALLEESVGCRLRSTQPVGILMSGGLDSTSVACLAARMSAPAPLASVSYVFDEFPDCDERPYINSVAEMHGLRSIQIPSDDLWPYRGWRGWPRNPSWPEGNPYRLVKERAFRRAREEGLGVMLTGGFGDELYSAGVDWLADLLADGRFRDAAREMGAYLRAGGLRWTLSADFTRRLARRLLDALPGGRSLRRRAAPPEWLTPYARGLLPDDLSSEYGVRENLLGLLSAQGGSIEAFHTSRHRLEFRHPYRDRRLVEFAAALPGYQLYFHGYYKIVLRNAMRGILPEKIRTRRIPTSLVKFYSHGIARERETIRSNLESASARWDRFVRPDWMRPRWDAEVSREGDGPHALVPWLCVAFETWRDNIGD